MPVSFLGNRKGYYFYGIVLKNASVQLRFTNLFYKLTLFIYLGFFPKPIYLAQLQLI